VISLSFSINIALEWIAAHVRLGLHSFEIIFKNIKIEVPFFM